MSEERKTNKTDPTKVAAGDVMAIVTFCKVDSVGPDADRIAVTGLDAGRTGKFSVIGRELVADCLSADRYTETVKATRTEMAELLISSHNRPLTVVFDKADGGERTLRGRLVKHEALLGRSMVEDLDVADAAGRVRLVDHRTLKKLIVDGVCYELKK